MGRPAWQTKGLFRSEELPESLSALWTWQLNQLECFGSRFELADSNILAVLTSPGDFFGSCGETDGRWKPVCNLPTGTHLAAQPGHNGFHWRPSVVSLTDGIGRSMLLDSGVKETWEYFNWLLLARAVTEGYNELILAPEDKEYIQVTWPATQQLRRILCLTGEDIGKWRYHIPLRASLKDLLKMSIEGIAVRH